MILKGKRIRSSVSTCRVCKKHTFSVALIGVTPVTLHEFTDFGELMEVLIKVPTLAAGTGVGIRLFDSDYLSIKKDARYHSILLVEGNTHDLELNMSVHQRGHTVH